MLSVLRRKSLSRVQYYASNPKIYHGKSEIKYDPKLTAYPFYGLRNNRSGAIFFNRPNYQNKLNLETMEEMYRFLRSYEIDESIQHIWVENTGHHSFSNGVDYKELIRSPKYLHRVFQLGIMMARINKPVFGYVKGLVGGTSAYLLNMFSTPFGNKNTHMKLHDIDNHFIPICGGSYLLSRLKGELGAYLALTGDEVDANDMVGTGFIYGLLRRDFSESELRKKAGDLSKEGARYFRYDTFDFGKSKQYSYGKQQVQDKADNFFMSAKIEKAQIMSDPRKQLRVARLAQLSYKTLEVSMENLRKPYNKINYQHSMDHFRHKQQPVLIEFEEKYVQPHKGQVVRGFPLHTINRIFAHDTVEQIIAALKKQGTEWAQTTIQKLQSKDQLTLKLTLKLIRQASKSTFQECLEREYRVASKIRLHDSFRKFHAGENVVKKSLSEISSDYVDRFFLADNHQHELLHDIVPNSLLPVKEYKNVLPDGVRFFLNKQFFNDPNNEGINREALRWLSSNGISYTNDTFDLDELRRRVYLYHNALRKLNSHWDKIDRLYYNHAAEKKFREARINYIDQIFAGNKISQLIEDKIRDNFNKKFHGRMQDLKPTAQVFAKEQKGKLYSALRNILVKKRLTEVDGQNKPEHVLKLVKFDQKGESSERDPRILFEGTVLEQIIKNQDSDGKSAFLPDYYQKLNEQVDPVEVDPLVTTTHNPELMEVLRRYEQGMFFYSKNDHRQDLALFQKAAAYSQKVKELLSQYSENELKDILFQEQRFSWKHLLEEIQSYGNETPSVLLDSKVNLPDFKESYDLSKENEALLEKIHTDFPSEFVIPESLRERSTKLLNLISNKILTNFGKWNIDNHIPLLDNWVRQTIAFDAVQFIKNDCHFIFAYFMIKDIEGLSTQLGNLTGNDALEKLRELGIIFQNAEDIEPAFHKYIVDLMELYNSSAQNIVLKNTKLLEMHNRIQTNEQVESSTPKIDKFLIELGRLRLKLKERTSVKTTVFNYDTQFNLQTLAKQNLNEQQDNLKTHLSVTAKAYDTKFKRLAKGYQSFISRIDLMFKRINSTTDFLPEFLASIDNLEGFDEMTQDIDENEPLELWFERKLSEAVELVFNHRLEAEKNLSNIELKYLDQEISNYLTPSFLKSIMVSIMDADISSLMTLKQQEIKSQDIAVHSTQFVTPRRFIVNEEAFRKLTNLVDSINVIGARTQDKHNMFERYSNSFDRLIREMTKEKPQKVLNEQPLRSINFTTSEKLQKFDNSDTNFIKGQLKVLTRIYSEDSDMIELSKILG